MTPDGSEIASVVSIAEGSEAADRGAVQSASAARTSGEIDDASASTSPGTGVDRAENAALGTAQRTEARAEASAGEGEAAQGSGGSSEEGVGTRASLGTLMTTSAATTAGSSSPAVSTWDQYMSPPAQNLVRAEDVLDQRYITREPLNASIPVVLDIPHRMELLKVVSGINQLPPADLVAVAMDWFLRGGAASPDAMQEPWNTYVGPGTPEDTPRAEDVLQRRFIKREGLKWQTPEELKLNQRLAVYRVMNRLKVPAADIVAVGIDRWLRVMGF
ncbi:hypothetical protein ACFY1P_20610 [Streptomyces sp. NPDC001407]|uniref:hypothetical protein n=1 Tax=Streptomyces sp. NPDC001407 TaxID=3364573 RepID=UPI003698A05C